MLKWMKQKALAFVSVWLAQAADLWLGSLCATVLDGSPQFDVCVVVCVLLLSWFDHTVLIRRGEVWIWWSRLYEKKREGMQRSALAPWRPCSLLPKRICNRRSFPNCVASSQTDSTWICSAVRARHSRISWCGKKRVSVEWYIRGCGCGKGARDECLGCVNSS